MRDTTDPDSDDPLPTPAPDPATADTVVVEPVVEPAAVEPVAVEPVVTEPGPAVPPHGVLTGTARLHADPGAARRARVVMGEWLTAWWGPPEGDPPGRAGLRDRLAVVLSELVSNAVVHGATTHDPDPDPHPLPALEVELHEFARTVRLVVADRTRRPGEPAFHPPAEPRLPDETAERGRGLFIVDALSDIWHAEPVSDGLVVWCDFALDPE